MGDKGERCGGWWTNKEIAVFRAKTRARWLASLNNGRRRYGRPRG